MRLRFPSGNPHRFNLVIPTEWQKLLAIGLLAYIVSNAGYLRVLVFSTTTKALGEVCNSSHAKYLMELR